jgi:CzcA family heavy metal efflux pump
MINALIDFSIRHRLLVLVMTLLMMAYGAWVATKLPVDVFPNLNRPTVTIFSESQGLAAEEVETLVTRPIEAAVNGAPGVDRVRSSSMVGLSLIWVEFDWTTDIYIARQTVAEKLQGAREVLPEGIDPYMGPIASIMGEVFQIGLTSNDPSVTSMDIRTYAEWDIRNRLLSIPGIAEITVLGGDLKQYQVLVDPTRLSQYGKSLHDVKAAIQGANISATGGFMISNYTETLIRVNGRVGSIEDLARSPLPKTDDDAPPIRLDQVAEVRMGGPLGKRGDASINMTPAVVLSIQKQPDADTLGLTRLIEEEVKGIKASLPSGMVLHDDIFRQANFIERAIHNVEEALRDGSILVALILTVFLLNFRTTFITLTAIPLSLLVTAIVFHWMGMSINTMTLGGLAVAIGELVDDAIVGVENVYRRLRENRLAGNKKDPLDVIREASSEVRGSIVFATIIVVLVFVPLFAMQGIEGRIFTPLGVAYIVSILASLLVSLTVTPALCAYMLPNLKRLSAEHDGFVIRSVKKTQRWVLDCLFPRSTFVFVTLAFAFVLSVGMFATFGREFLPQFNEGSVTITIFQKPGTSLDESNRIGNVAERLLQELPEIEKTSRRAGRAERDDHVKGVYATELEATLLPSDRSRAEVFSDIRDKLTTIPGISVEVGQPISHRIDHMLSGVQAQIAIKLFGPDLNVLRSTAEEIKSAMESVPGVVDLAVEKQVLIPQLHVNVDREQAAARGLMPGEVAEYAQLAMQGEKVGAVLDGERSHDIVMRLKDDARDSAEAIRQIPIDTEDDHIVPLDLVADIEEAKGANLINRENAQRRIIIQANSSARDLVGVVDKIKETIAEKVDLPEGYYLVYSGQFESQASASKMIALLSLLSFLGMFIVLYAHFKSANLAVQVMLAIPLAFIGAAIGIWLTGGIFSIATLVGFITLTGIAARNGIMMIAHYLHLMEHEGEKFDLAMIYRGTSERIVPVMMTALTASLALVPILMAAGQPGREIIYPVAVVIFSGLFTSTLLDLTVRPLLFWRFGRKPVSKLIPNAIIA